MTIATSILETATQALAAGQVIAHPTETVFGLAADPFNPVAMQRLLSIKGRTDTKGFILLIPDQTWLTRLVLPLSPLAEKLITCFWPGPLTLVLPAHPDLATVLTGGSGYIALRHSPSPLVDALLHRWQKPLASTSANLTGQTPVRCAAEARQQWDKTIAVILEGHTAPNALPSTVLRVNANCVQLLRNGAITTTQLQQTVPELIFGVANNEFLF